MSYVLSKSCLHGCEFHLEVCCRCAASANYSLDNVNLCPTCKDVPEKTDEEILRNLLECIFDHATVKIPEDDKVLELVKDPVLKDKMKSLCTKHHANLLVQNMEDLSRFLTSRYGNQKEDHDPYICSICQGILENPLKALECGHIFCKRCVDHLFTQSGWGDKALCPKCRKDSERCSVVYL